MSLYQFQSLLSETGLKHGTSARYDSVELNESGSPLIQNESRLVADREHQKRFLNSIGIEKKAATTLKQIHSNRVHLVEAEGLPEGLEGDALITAQQDIPIGVMTADCVPLILYDPVTYTSGVVHAGRAGTSQGIVQAAIRQMSDVFGVKPSNLKVALGPSVGPCCYEVGEDCLTAFREVFSDWEEWVQPHTKGKVLLDLWKANQDQAVAEGVPLDQIFFSGECTVCKGERWFSYRREGSRAGRMLTVAMLCRR